MSNFTFNVIATAWMILVFLVDSQLELRPEIVSLILRTEFIKRMTALGQGMVLLSKAQKGVVHATGDLRTAIGYACERVDEGDLVTVDSFGGFWVARSDDK